MREHSLHMRATKSGNCIPVLEQQRYTVTKSPRVSRKICMYSP